MELMCSAVLSPICSPISGDLAGENSDLIINIKKEMFILVEALLKIKICL